ncbi:hypothetical protein ES332_A03G249600v1 [Gossypium tomentosum]|uniref:YDG domain-containing protein n=1 Tax=Gossypium tomentosum TaxID=34277 RepID=A0A5D2RC02_GOSTO|nr:hypothetical protein ES332_A03G249600v1 [Gossypium tomentosum]
MAALRQKLGNGKSSSKLNRAKDGKRVIPCKGLFRDDKEKPFTAKWYETRRNIKKALSFYRELLDNKQLLNKLWQEHENGRNRGLKVHIRAAKVVVRTMGKWVNTSKQIGPISGTKIGDHFYWRGELSIVGLHHEFQRGIDYMKLINGKILATSIVDSGRYHNVDEFCSDKLAYCGEGDNPNKDQKLVRGNLALKNNMDDKMPVRVIRKVNDDGSGDRGCNYKFVYDGLFCVTEYWKEKGKFGKEIYKFLLRKCEEGDR